LVEEFPIDLTMQIKSSLKKTSSSLQGPSGETMALSQFKGKAKAALQAAMEEYGALSTAFPSTNPWNWDGFSRTCNWILR